MSDYATTKLSSKGQVVIPEDIREQLHLKEGDQFIVIGQGDAVIFKAITPPSLDEFDGLLAQAKASAKKAKAKQSDVMPPSRRQGLLIRAVIDTNVFVSGVFESAHPARCYKHGQEVAFLN